MEHAPNPYTRTFGAADFLSCVFQHAPGGVDVQDLRPLRGRPCGPIPDTDAYRGAPTHRARRSKIPRTRLTDPAPFRDERFIRRGRTGCETSECPVDSVRAND